MKIEVKGLQGVLEQLRSVEAELGQKALASAARAAFRPVAETARGLVPVDSGELRAGISIRVVKPKTGQPVVAAGLVVNTTSTLSRQATVAAAAFGEAQSRRLPPSRRWHFAELGTVHQAAKPFLRPALDKHAQGIVDSLSDLLRKRIAAALKRKSRGGK